MPPLKKFLATALNCIVENTETASIWGAPGAVETDAAKLSATKATLILSMETTMYPHVKKCTTTLEVWRKVKELFEDRGHLRRKGRLQSLVTNKLDDCDIMAAYIANVMSTVSKLENIGLKVDDEWIIAFLLVGLSEKYQSFMGLGANKELTSDEVKMKLL